MTIKGTIESRLMASVYQNADWYCCNETFVSLYNFFNGLSTLGVTRIAYNRGSSGTGMTYWDLGAPPGNGAWALFRFGNATIPFYVLLQGSCISTRYNFSYSSYAGCLPCVGSDATTVVRDGTYANCSIAVAMRADGSSPWNGTTVNTGTDTKGTPVWTPGASALAVWPRCNAVGGTQATNREAVTTLTVTNNDSSNNGYYDCYNGGGRIQMLADENNFLLAFDGTANGSYSQCYFGKYVPRTGVNPNIPYVMLNNAKSSDPAFARVNYGALSNTTPTWAALICDGGVCHPNATLGVKIAYIDYPIMMQDIRFHPSRASVNFGRFDTFPLFLCMNESPYYGVLGTIDFFRACYGVPACSMTPDKNYAILGYDTIASTKSIVPWDGLTNIGTGINRIGISF